MSETSTFADEPASLGPPMAEKPALTNAAVGVEEANHSIPEWWLWTFFIAVCFAAGYWLYYQSFAIGATPLEQFNRDRLAALDTGEPVTAADIDAIAADELALQNGAALYAKVCVRCHGASGQGNVGPNLTDEFWIGGGSSVDIFNTIYLGRPGKGMQAWGPTYGRGGVLTVAAFVATEIVGTNIRGKEAQGERWQPAAEESEQQAPSGELTIEPEEQATDNVVPDSAD